MNSLIYSNSDAGGRGQHDSNKGEKREPGGMENHGGMKGPGNPENSGSADSKGSMKVPESL